MTEPTWRPDGAYIIQEAVAVPFRICAIITRQAGLKAWANARRGADPQMDQVVHDMTMAGLRWVTSAVGKETRQDPVGEAPSKWLTATEAAELVGVSARAARLAAHEGRIPAEKFGGQWQISREDAEHWKASRRAA